MKKIKIKSVPRGKTANISPFPNFNMSTPGEINTNHTGTDSQDITDTVKPVDRNIANIEAEKGELLLKPMLDGLYKISGKPHSQGGTPLRAQEGTFIFSNDKDLAITKEECEMYDFKKPNNKKKSEYTPAKVVQREFSPKEYNTLISIINDPQKDQIAKNTAAMMLMKHQEKLGQVALLQEAKKGLPQGVPDFAAPAAEKSGVEDELAMFKKGGSYYDGGFSRFVTDPIDPYKKAKTAQGSKTPTGYDNGYDRNELYMSRWNRLIPGVGNMDNKAAQSAIYDYMLKNDKPAVQNMWSTYGLTNRGKGNKDLLNLTNNGVFNNGVLDNDDNLSALRDAYVDGMFGVRQMDAPRDPAQPVPLAPSNYRKTPLPGIQPRNTGTPGPLKPNGEIPWEGFNLGMTDVEKLSVAAPFLQAAAMPTYYDMLQQKHNPLIRLDRVDNQGEIQNIQSQSALAQREMFGNMPGGQAYLNSDGVRANEIQNIANSEYRKNQQNIPIANQEEMTNLSLKMDEQNYNLGQIGQTYDNNVLARQRRNEMLANGAAQSLNNGLDIEQNIQALEQSATAAAMPYLTHMKDANGNEVMVQGPNGERLAIQGVPMGFTKNRMPIFQPGFGSLDSFGVQSQMSSNSQILLDMQDAFRKAVSSGDTKLADSIARGMYSMSRQNTQQAYNNPFINMLQGLNIHNR